MPLKTINPTATKAWEKLAKHYQEMKDQKLVDLFAEDASRAEKFQLKWNNFFVDYSKNRINTTTKDLLLELANEVELKDAIEKQFNGDKINQTEGRAVLHTALRGNEKPEEVKETLQKMKDFSQEVISGEWKGYTDKAITDVVNIGIGGSDLGPQMIVDSLQYYRNHLGVHFISNVDGDHVMETIQDLDPETTLFIIVSKSFTTQETITNANTVRNWFLKTAAKEDVAKHFVAVSTNLESVKEFGIADQNIFPMWNWVGGRFSLWSAVGLSIACAVGFDNYQSLLDGAGKMDEHFQTTDFKDNIPVTLALLSIWYNNFFDAETEAIIPYSQYLHKLVPYLQQGIMESNGKSVSRDGNKIPYQTGTIVWGEPGTNSQHAFFQLIHQGTKLIPCDFIGFKKSLHGNKEHQDKLMANFFAQTEALLKGKTPAQVEEELKDMDAEKASTLKPFKVFEGNKPTNTLLIDKLTPETLGSLVALYEHKLFVQGVIWNIFSYDQWGVELGKQLANGILKQMETKDFSQPQDASTQSLVKEYLS